LTVTHEGEVIWGGRVYAEGREKGWRRGLQRWRVAGGAVRAVWSSEVSGFLAVSANGRRALCTHMREGVEGLAVYELDDPPTIMPLPRIGRSVSTAAIGGDGRWAVSADYEHDLFVWNVDRAFEPLPHGSELGWQSGLFKGFSASAPIAVFATSTITLVDTDTGATSTSESVPAIYDDNAGPAATASAPADRAAPMPASRNAAIKKTRANDFPVDDFGRSRGHTATIFNRRLSPDGRWEVTVSHDGTARVWDVFEERSIASYGSDVGLRRCRWASDSRTLAITDVNERTHLLRLEGVS
jgi:WD40 repeat protein